MSEPLVSVIMPAYNAEATLEESARSVLAQTFKNLELIIVDDGSEDDTQTLSERLCAEDNRVIAHRCANGGVSRARNTGISLAKGRFIAFLDADDLYATEKLEKQLSAIAANEADVVTTGVRRFTVEKDSWRWLGESYPPNLDNDAHRTMLLEATTSQYVNFNTAMARREVFVETQYDPKLRTGEDWDIWIRLAQQWKFAAVDEPLFFYRKHPGSVTAGYGNWETLQTHLHILEKNGIGLLSRSCIDKRRDDKVLEFMSHALVAKNYREFFKILNHGLHSGSVIKRRRFYELLKDHFMKS